MGPFTNRIQRFNPVGDLNFNFKYKEKADKSIVILLSASYFRMFDKELKKTQPLLDPIMKFWN